MTHTAYIALGSNLGGRHENLHSGLRVLEQHAGIRLGKVSAFLETTPVGGPPGQCPYLNAAAEIQTDLEPRQLLQVLLDVERNLGRVRGEANLPRTLDLDLLLYDNLVLKEDDLSLPHPRLHQRWFVLAPLAEIAPGFVHPELGRTIRELLQGLQADESTGGPVSSPARELSGLKALVTGATSGIGKAIALELASAGADIMVHGRREPAAKEIAQLASGRQVQSRVLLADLHSPEQCQSLVRAAFDVWGHIDIWINNAGADTLIGEAAHWPFEKKLRELFAVDVTATMSLSCAVGERMKRRGRGVIVNMGWDQAETGMEGDSGQLFAAAKSAVMAFSKSLALTLAPEVRVNCIAPGWIRTAWAEKASATWQERAIREAPLRRWGTPEDVARTVRWLVSPAADFITGQAIRVNGGAVR